MGTVSKAAERDLYTILQYLHLESVLEEKNRLRRRFTSNESKRKRTYDSRIVSVPNLATRGLICIRVLAISNGEHANAPSVPPAAPATACIRTPFPLFQNVKHETEKMKPKKI